MDDAGASEVLMPVAPMAESVRHAVAGMRMGVLLRALSRLHCAIAQVLSVPSSFPC